MDCAIPQDAIERVIAFHGHNCPGLAIGIRAAELALKEFGHNEETGLVAVVETDMCGVDAIQVLTGCTFGKGNLIHRDVGKMAFSFYSRSTGTGFRALLNPAVRADMDGKLAPLMKRISQGTATEDDRQQANALRLELQERFMESELEQLFTVTPKKHPGPRPARILESLACEACGESTMESRTRRFAGQTLCIPCFEAVEQKV